MQKNREMNKMKRTRYISYFKIKRYQRNDLKRLFPVTKTIHGSLKLSLCTSLLIIIVINAER